MTAVEQKVTEIIEPVIADLGFALVQVRMVDGALQIFAENPQTNNLGIEDCKTISKAVSVILDVEDPISGAYRLEVSSPGIDRPLVKAEDYTRYTGFEAKVECKVPTETGQKKFRGTIKGLDGDVVELTTDQGEARIPFSDIAKAKLVLTDELIKATAQT